MIVPPNANWTYGRFRFCHTPRTARVESATCCHSDTIRPRIARLCISRRHEGRYGGRPPSSGRHSASSGQTSEKESQVSEEREKIEGLENDEASTENDVEAHKKWGKDADPTASDDSDDVEAHAKLGKW